MTTTYVRAATDDDRFFDVGEPMYYGTDDRMGLLQLWHAARCAADGGIVRDRHGYPQYDADGILARRIYGTSFQIVEVVA